MSNAAPDLPPRIADSRKTPRERVVLPGMVIYGDGAFSINCRIKDISEVGARIIVSAGLAVPTHIVFMEVRSRVVHDAVVVRMATPEFGVQFTSTYLLDGELPPHLQHLKRLR
jgi:PilZ domain